MKKQLFLLSLMVAMTSSLVAMDKEIDEETKRKLRSLAALEITTCVLHLKEIDENALPFINAQFHGMPPCIRLFAMEMHNVQSFFYNVMPM